MGMTDATGGAMLDPALSASDLAKLAADRPDLWNEILEHPNVYDQLSGWIAERQLEATTRLIVPPTVAMPSAAQEAAPVAQQFEPVQTFQPVFASPSSQTIQPQPQKSSKTPLIIALIAIFVLLLGLVAALFFTGTFERMFGSKEEQAVVETPVAKPDPTPAPAPKPEAPPELKPEPKPEPKPEAETKPEPVPPAQIVVPTDCVTMNSVARAASEDHDRTTSNPAGFYTSKISNSGYFDDSLIGQKAKDAMRAASETSACQWITNFHGGITQYNAKISEATRAPFLKALRESDFTESSDGNATIFIIEYRRDGNYYRVQHVFVGDIWATITDNHGSGGLANAAAVGIRDANPQLKQ